MVEGLNREQKNLLRHIRTIFAFNTVAPLYYMGVVAASEFLVYDAAKLYLALEFGATYAGIASTGIKYCSFYNEADAVCFGLVANSIAYDSAGSQIIYLGNSAFINNLYFSRVVATGYLHIKFNGYRLTIV